MRVEWLKIVEICFSEFESMGSRQAEKNRKKRARDKTRAVSTGLTKRKFRDAECADITYVGARRPCPAFLGRRVRQSNARNVMAQAFIA